MTRKFFKIPENLAHDFHKIQILGHFVSVFLAHSVCPLLFCHVLGLVCGGERPIPET